MLPYGGNVSMLDREVKYGSKIRDGFGTKVFDMDRCDTVGAGGGRIFRTLYGLDDFILRKRGVGMVHALPLKPPQ